MEEQLRSGFLAPYMPHPCSEMQSKGEEHLAQVLAPVLKEKKKVEVAVMLLKEIDLFLLEAHKIISLKNL